ncbi:MAG TPA: hypothetical protein VGX76_01860 [Pirellulales bacterium]|nr:hypothetical protein [Pirellulales bacterium]
MPKVNTDLKRSFRQLLQSLADESRCDRLLDSALGSLGDQFFEQLNMLPADHFARQDRLGPLTLESVVENRAAHLCRVVENENGAAIEFPGNRIGGPPRIAPALRFVAEATRFAVRELPDVLKDDAKIVLVRRLVREGLLAPVEAMSGTGATGGERAEVEYTCAPAAQAETTKPGAFPLEDDHGSDITTEQLAETVGTTRGASLVGRQS